MMLGKLPQTARANIQKVTNNLSHKMPSPPATVDNSCGVKSWPMMYNDQWADCAIAAVGHMIQQWTMITKGGPGNATVLQQQDIQAAYQVFVGNNLQAFVKLADVMSYWQNPGIGITGQANDVIVGSMLLDQKSQIQAQASIYLFGNCYIGLALPAEVLPPLGNDTPAQHTARILAIPWDDAAAAYLPKKANGHCVPAVGYDQNNLYVVTWGALKSMSWKFYLSFMDEAYAVFSPDWLKNPPPPGFDFASLQQDLQEISPPSRQDIKDRVLPVLNAAIPAHAPLPGGAKSIPNTVSAESWSLWNDCSLSPAALQGLSRPLSAISTDPAYPHGIRILAPETKALNTVGDAITLTWNRAKGIISPAKAG